MDPIDQLLLEHQQVERLLEALDVCAGRVEDGEAPGVQDLLDFARVFAGVYRPCHHRKEEQLLIPLMAEHGVPTDAGILAALRREHDEERELTEALVAAARAGDAPRAVEAAFALTDHARCHIFTEDTIVFPKARSLVPSGPLQALSSRFALLDQEVCASAEHVRLEATRSELLARYGTDPACIQPRVRWEGTED